MCGLFYPKHAERKYDRLKLLLSNIKILYLLFSYEAEL